MSASHALAPSHGVRAAGAPCARPPSAAPSGPVEVRENNPSGRGSGPLVMGRGALPNWVPSSWWQVQLLGSASVTSCLPAGVLTL